MRRFIQRTLTLSALLLVANLATAGGNGCTNCAPTVVAGVGSATPCTDCGPTVKSSIHSKVVSHPTASFMFGSSRNFFAPCNSGMCDMLGGPRKQPCALPVYGSGIGQPADNCKGPVTFMNR